MEVDDIQQLLGGYKFFQLVAYFTLAFFYMRGAWHVFSPIYLAYDPGHHCALPPNATLNGSVPWVEKDGVWGWDQCNMYVTPGEGNVTEACAHGWTYDFLPGETSFVAEWDLVCDDGYLAELSTTIYMVGTTCGAVFLTPLSDVYGRKPVILASLWLQAALGFGLAWVHNFILFTVIRFFIGLFNMTVGLCVYCLLSESFPSTHRLLPAVSVQFFWAAGIALLALFGYLLRDWRHLEMVISLPNLLSVVCIWSMSESIPWLVSKNKLDRAENVIRRAARMNDIQLPVDIREKLQEAARTSADVKEPGSKKGQEKAKEASVITSPDLGGSSSDKEQKQFTALSLLCISKINVYCLVMFFLFLANSLGYFGVLFLTPTLDGDRFLNLLYSAAVEVPAYIIAFLSHRFIGRRIPTCLFLIICAVGNIAAIFVPSTTGL